MTALDGFLADVAGADRQMIRARTAVVLAHPDDEALACGALLRRLADVTLVHVTDGAPRDGVDARRNGFADVAAYADARRREVEAALAVAQATTATLVSLGVADQGAALVMPDIAHRLVPLIEGCDVILTHAFEGGHPDHDEVHAADSRDLDGFLDHLCRLHGARWRRRGEAGALDDDVVQRFHREALPHLVEADLATLLTLTADDRVVGAYYGLRQPGRAYAYLGGFDPDYSSESPGTVLLGHAIADASARGAREFHLLRGQEPYKYAWGAADRWNQRRSWRRGLPL